MNIIDELQDLQKIACRIYQVDGFCNECPYRKEDGCMIDREIARQKSKGVSHGSA